MAFSTVNYDGNANSFQGIEVSYTVNGIEEKSEFNTGDPIIDYYDYQKWLHERTKEFWSENCRIGGSSSWDHFIMDSKKIYESHFDPETLEFADWRKPFNEGNYDLYKKITETYPTVWHTKKMKNFLDVKKYYRKVKGMEQPESEIAYDEAFKKAVRAFNTHMKNPNLDRLEAKMKKIEDYVKEKCPDMLDMFKKRYDEFEYSVIGILNKK